MLKLVLYTGEDSSVYVMLCSDVAIYDSLQIDDHLDLDDHDLESVGVYSTWPINTPLSADF